MILTSLLTLYDREVVFLNQSGEYIEGVDALGHELAPFAAIKAHFEFNIKQIIEAGDIALTHTAWKISALVCDRGGPPSAGRHLALADR